jgi:DNA helicase II / ATP-dependent DNA helicase PcrA
MALTQQLNQVPATAPRPPRAAAAPVSLEQVGALLRGLNREQRRAVTHPEGPLLVLAGPGTGKTEVITRRIAWLISTKRALPREILALTFTAKAAAEMQARVDLLVPYGQADTAVHTFHAFGDRILREHAFELGLPGDLRLISRAEAIVLLREHVFSLGLERYRPLADPVRFLGGLVDLFLRAKDEGVLPQQMEDHADSLLRRASTADDDEGRELRDLAGGHAEVARAYRRYQELLVERGLIDHSDQVLLCLRLLSERPHVRRALHERFRYLLVDEFQDTNPSQLQMVLELTGRSGNVTVVGDDDQAIYAFRGAAVNNMRRFAFAQPDLRRIVLRRNYRSLAPIIEASQRLIAHNDSTRLAVLAGVAKEPVAHRRASPAAPLRVIAHGSREEEADAFAREIAERIGKGARPRDFAILVRTNGDTEPFVRSLAALGVPVSSSTPVPLSERPEVRALMAFLRVVADPASSADLYHLACAQPYGLSGPDLTSIMSFARRRHRPLWDVLLDLEEQPGLLRLSSGTRRGVKKLVSDVGAALEQCHERSAGEVLYDFLRRSGRLARLVEGGRPGDEPGALADIVRFFELVRAQSALLSEDRITFLAPYLSELGAAGDRQADDGPPEGDEVSVLTVHRAKGLEFRVVFVCGLADGRFPRRGRAPALVLPAELCGGGDAPDDFVIEERRLFYVAMTRARDELWLSCALDNGTGRTARRPSPFIAEALDMPLGSEGLSPRPRTLLPPLPPARQAPREAPRLPATEAPLSLSFSQLDDYFGCPERYRLRHVVGVPTPAHHALVYGNALHQAVAAYHLRQAKGETMSEEALLKVFAAHWSAEGFLSRQHEEARYQAGQAALRRFRLEMIEQETPAPAAVERPFTFSIGADQLKGRMDRLDETPQGTVITDYKSSDVRDQAKADQKARESLQLQVYALAHRAQGGELPGEVRLHFLDSGVVGKAVPDPVRLERATKRISRAAEDIRAGRFAAQPNPVACGFCPFRAICPSSAA